MVTLTNDFLTVTIDPHGAEVTSIINNHTDREYIWQADPSVWKRHAPVLFPIVGALKNDEYQYNGQTYHMTQHGFARDRDFEVEQQSKTAAVFTLTDDAETHKMYPFKFVLKLTFLLENNGLTVTYHVENPDETAPLYVSIGGHPGFQIPLTDDTKFEDYYLGFQPLKSRVRIPLVAGEGIDYAHRTLASTDANLQLSHDFFKNDAVIYELNGRSAFSLRSDKTRHGVILTVADAPYLGVWSPYPKTGNFVCLEPWWGIADTIDATGDFTQKLGINKLDPITTFDHSYLIEIF
ncbi:aldose 1-epimerase family protein [Lacticaseibacillus hegangensis]|uniref:Aldose 1-epimerase family protein n=1 Tax=Lacticaseibacillus hegangensis TaxID=2486010 RepID=A0ABW4CTK3_9LACO|nr:aldose 1-epimerase family protein [Lacticaseibacillus hegangensis]